MTEFGGYRDVAAALRLRLPSIRFRMAGSESSPGPRCLPLRG